MTTTEEIYKRYLGKLRKTTIQVSQINELSGTGTEKITVTHDKVVMYGIQDSIYIDNAFLYYFIQSTRLTRTSDGDPA